MIELIHSGTGNKLCVVLSQTLPVLVQWYRYLLAYNLPTRIIVTYR